jgi:hypothetical protein
LFGMKAVTFFIMMVMGLVLAATSLEAGEISTSTTNGKTVVTWNGKEVWEGETSGPVSAMAKTVNGKEYAAAFEDKAVLWENVSGAAKEVGPSPDLGKR